MRAMGGVLLAAVLSGCAVELQHDLSEEEANQIYVALFKRKLNPQKVRTEASEGIRYTITVPKQEVPHASEILQKLSLPRPKPAGLGVFKATKGIIPTATEERAMFIEALGGEISNALSQVPGTLEAKVIVMIPEVNDLTQPEKKPLPSASVFIKYLSMEPKKDYPFTEDRVKEFVAKAVPELTPAAISVLMAAVDEPPLDETANDRPVEMLSPQLLKTIIGVLASLLLLSTGFIVFSLVRKPKKAAAPPAPAAVSQPE